MEVQLKPVIELIYNDPKVESPKEYPYWKNQLIWYEYRNHLLEKAGFTDKFEPYLVGSPFYEPNKITDKSLGKIVVDHVDGFLSGEYEREEMSALFGGYVVKIDGENKFYPQCCSDLSDIYYWESLSKQQEAYSEGHPAPDYKFSAGNVILNFSVGEFDEHFEPTPHHTILEISVEELKFAVKEAKLDLYRLSHRLDKINRDQNLGIDRIGDLLIWKNPNRE